MDLLLALALVFGGFALASATIALRLRRLARGLYSGNRVPHDIDGEA